MGGKVVSCLIYAFPFEHLSTETADCSPSGSLGPVLDRAPRDQVIYSGDAAAMCRDVGSQLTAGAPLYGDEATGPRSEESGGPRVKIWGKMRTKRSRQGEDVNTERLRGLGGADGERQR